MQLGEHGVEIPPGEVIAGFVNVTVRCGDQGRELFNGPGGHVRGVGQGAFVQRHTQCWQ
jgi:hypothetical protein